MHSKAVFLSISLSLPLSVSLTHTLSLCVCVSCGSKAAIGLHIFTPVAIVALAEPEMDIDQTKDLGNELELLIKNFFIIVRLELRQLAMSLPTVHTTPFALLLPLASLSFSQCIFRGSNYFRICWPLEC